MLTAIFTFELRNFNHCDVQINLRGEASGRDIYNEPPPILSFK